ncbi:MAG: hypothetical protein MUF51_08445, partial [Vicinamibacteria bacterium]|nr:hypothetical protein [Vicinamibacteria bacterium]
MQRALLRYVCLAVLGAMPFGPLLLAQEEGKKSDTEDCCRCGCPGSEPAPALPPAEILALDASAFEPALATLIEKETLPTNDDLRPLFDRCHADQGDGAFPAYPCALLAHRMFQQAAPSEESWLWEQFDRFTDQPELSVMLIKTLLSQRIKEQIDELPALAPFTPAQIDGELQRAWEAADPELQALLAQADPQLKEAWQLFEAIQDIYKQPRPAAASPAEQGAPDCSAERITGILQGLERAIADYLRGRSTATAAAAALDRSDPLEDCGLNGVFSMLRLKAVIVVALDQGRYDLALAAALQLPDAFADESSTQDSVRRLIEASGLDYGTLMVGALLHRQHIHFKDLIEKGNDSTARLLLAMGHLVQPDSTERPLEEQSDFLAMLSAFVTPSGACEAYKPAQTYPTLERKSAQPISIAAQLDILDELQRVLAATPGLETAQAAAHQLVRLCRHESLPAFWEMTRSPFASVRSLGALALRAHGEQPPESRTPVPVKFRFVVDGQPLAATQVQWAAWDTEHPRHNGGATTDDSGLVAIDADFFADPRRAIVKLYFSSQQNETPDDLWFAVDVPMPRDPSTTTIVAIATQSLTLQVRPPFDAGAPPVLILRRPSPAADDSDSNASYIFLDKEPGEQMRFPRLQRGTFQMEWQQEGAAWRSHEFTLGAMPVAL